MNLSEFGKRFFTSFRMTFCLAFGIISLKQKTELRIYKYYIVFLITFFFNNSYSQSPRLVQPVDICVPMTAEITKSPKPQITVRWKKNDLAKSYTITRKALNQDYWSPGNAFKTQNNYFIDKWVVPGIAYEYMVESKSNGSVFRKFRKDNGNVFDSIIPENFNGYGYICSGIDLPEQDNSGKVLLLIDSIVAPALTEQIDRLSDDLMSEGWEVVRRLAPRREQFDGKAVKFTKKILLDEYFKTGKLNSILIIGRVPVPYSGNIAPDGHSNHEGAWPCDLYYGMMKENYWTDTLVNNDSTADRPENKNRIGDGKFDQDELVNINVDVAVGRVDFYGINVFTNGFLDKEINLLKKYLDKNHKYRRGQLQYKVRGLVDDNFGFYTKEGFAASGYRNFQSLLGVDSTLDLDFFTTLSTDTYLWAYACGGGYWDGANGVGNTLDFYNKGAKAVFTMLFGSFHGDWDSGDNFMRGALCSDPSILTCCWAGRPPWFFHHMAAGFPIGYSTLISQNNSELYRTNYFDYLQSQQAYGERGIHVALMGDPTLRMFMGAIEPPTNLQIIPKAESNQVELKWDAPHSISDYYFNIYRRLNDSNRFEKINSVPLNQTSYTETISYQGNVTYMVKTIAPQKTNTAIFMNQSIGLTGNSIITGVEEIHDNELSLDLSPIPCTEELKISITIPDEVNVNLAIYDVTGAEIRNWEYRNCVAGTIFQSWDLTTESGERLLAGVYFVRLIYSDKVIVKKIVVVETK
ncbi:MAG: type sorting protein [Ignavibacteria bacterium]|nr:type sorting protein [Ignavibacteria bacterium]